MASKGITDMLGASIQNMLGTSSSGWVIMFVFAFATVLLANITGSNYGTLLIMAPIAASTAVVAGVDPRGIVLATMGSALASVLLPLDTAMGVIFANGKYNLVNTLKYTIPLTILYIGALCLSTGLLFPF